MKVMKSKKGVGRRVLGLMVLGVVVLSVVLVSAGLLDIFKFGDDSDLEGELGESAVARVEVGAPSSPPNITYVGSPGNDVSLSLCPSSTSVTFSFLATQNGIKGGLPESNLLSEPYIMGNVTNGTDTRTFTSCSYVDDVDVPALCLGGGCKNYTCTYSANYYDVPDSNWVISIQMSSLADSNGFGLVNNSATLQYNPNYDFTINIGYVNWTNPALQATDVRRPSDDPLVITNCGNTKIENGTTDYLRINATKLIGDGGQGDTIGASNFTANDLGAPYCDSNGNFTEGDWYNLEFTLDRGVATQNLGFCLQQIPLLTVVPQSFTTTNNWTLDYTYTP